jgi:hypothetical protein
MTLQQLYTDLLSKYKHADTKMHELRDAAEDEYNEAMRFDSMRDWESADEHYALYDDYTEEADQWEKERDAYDDMMAGLRKMKDAQEALGWNITLEVEA